MQQNMSELLKFILDHVEHFRRSVRCRRHMNLSNNAIRARLPSLYSDFTMQRHTNPDGYAANVAAWEEALQKAATAGFIPAPGYAHDTLSLRTGEDLLRSLETKEWGRPLSLEMVIVGERFSRTKCRKPKADPIQPQDEAISKRHMIPFQEFLDAPTSIYNQKWSPWLFSWGLQQLRLSRRISTNGKSRNAQLVMLPNVEVCS